MARSELNFNTGTLVNPIDSLKESVGAGSIFAKILTANDEQKQQDKILAERAAERAEAKAERDQDRADRQARYKVEDFRVEKADAEKARTSDIVTSLNRDMSNEGMSTTMTPEQIAALTAQGAKYGSTPGSQQFATSAEFDANVAQDKATTDMYNKFVEQNKSNTAHAIKYGKDLNSTSYAPAQVLSDGKTTVEADPLIYSSQREKLLKPMTEGYAMSLYSNSPNASREQLMKKYKKETGIEMDAGIQKEIDDNIFKREQIDMQKEQNRISNAQVAETRKQTAAINNAKIQKENSERLQKAMMVMEKTNPELLAAYTSQKTDSPLYKQAVKKMEELVVRGDPLLDASLKLGYKKDEDALNKTTLDSKTYSEIVKDPLTAFKGFEKSMSGGERAALTKLLQKATKVLNPTAQANAISREAIGVVIPQVKQFMTPNKFWSDTGTFVTDSILEDAIQSAENIDYKSLRDSVVKSKESQNK